MQAGFAITNLSVIRNSLQLWGLNTTNTLEKVIRDLLIDTATAFYAESYASTTAPLNKEVELSINPELGSNDNDDGMTGNGNGSDDGDGGEDQGISIDNSDNGSPARKCLTYVGLFVALLEHCLLFQYKHVRKK